MAPHYKYEILARGTIEDLMRIVNSKLEQGKVLYGPLSFVQGLYTQVMIDAELAETTVKEIKKVTAVGGVASVGAVASIGSIGGTVNISGC